VAAATGKGTSKSLRTPCRPLTFHYAKYVSELTDAEIADRTTGLLALFWANARQGKDPTNDELDPFLAMLQEGMDEFRMDVEVRAGSQEELLDTLRRVAQDAANLQRRRSAVMLAKLVSLFCELGLAAEQESGPLDVSAIIQQHAIWAASQRDAEGGA